MRYIFPRQFGLHNVFTSKVDARETSMPFKDYTLREKEINAALGREIAQRKLQEEELVRLRSRVPKRLRGEPMALVHKLRRFNKKCSYVELLRRYCPVEVLSAPSQETTQFTDAYRGYIYPQCRTRERRYFSRAIRLSVLRTQLRAWKRLFPVPGTGQWNRGVSRTCRALRDMYRRSVAL
jgi:hypothetical protein